MSRILAVDVDLTVCPSDQGWLRWLDERCSYHNPSAWLDFKDDGVIKLPYNLGKMFTEVEDPLDYWRTLDYDQFQPLNASVEKLEGLSKYFDIVFVSAIKGTHSKNKYYWLKKHFSFMKGYMATKEKWLMNGSVVAMIDDRLDNLEGFDHHKRVHFKTTYEQTANCGVGYVIDDWESFNVADFCKQYLN